MMHWGNFVGMGSGGFGWIIMILFWILVILGIVYLVKQIFSDKEVPSRTESAENILKKRYAAGEITKEEYNKKLTAITI
ncbi:MAG TPA: SHOCT domain-containing protein [Nitrospirae bacterium]|nr:SHOCT domain-containing protein [Nitrospirota bacterium]